jgi:asparagine synthase (glutamine-hydrolysing)
MSGIGGILRFDGKPVERRDLDRMANALQMHGPDRADVVTLGSVGLVNVLMRMTPEDRFDRQPLRGPSGAVITADLRLDNRDDILARIGVAPSEAMAWPDSRVLLMAWEKLGEVLWPELRGVFAVALFDPRSRTLVLARDQVGQNVMVWHRNEHYFAFATMPKGLFALPEVPRVLSEEKIADFLVLNHSEHETTVYCDIFRLRPAHIATVSAGGAISHRRYWSAADIKPVRLGSAAAYAEGLRETLDRAVRRQLRSIHPVGCHLTGGLDSSSVTALAARALAEKGQRLTTYTHVPREGFAGPPTSGRYVDETPYVEAIRAMHANIDPNYLPNDQCDDFADLERLFLAFEAPLRNPMNLGWMLAITRLARAQGRRVLLGGMRGNYTISWSGWTQVADHLLHGRLMTVLRQMRLCYWETTHSRWTTFRKLIVEPLVPEPLAAWAGRRRHGSRPAWARHSAIRRDFAADMAVEARARAVGHDFHYRTPRGERARGLESMDYLGDWDAAEKAVHGVETRDPTADLDVISFCLGIPPEQFLAEGVDRSLVRRAMWGLLPRVVLTNRLSGMQSPDWYEKLDRRREQLAADVTALAASPLARKALDLSRLERALGNWPTSGWNTQRIYYEYNLAFTRAIAAGRFLQWFEAGNRGPADNR